MTSFFFLSLWECLYRRSHLKSTTECICNTCCKKLKLGSSSATSHNVVANLWQYHPGWYYHLWLDVTPAKLPHPHTHVPTPTHPTPTHPYSHTHPHTHIPTSPHSLSIPPLCFASILHRSRFHCPTSILPYSIETKQLWPSRFFFSLVFVPDMAEQIKVNPFFLHVVKKWDLKSTSNLRYLTFHVLRGKIQKIKRANIFPHTLGWAEKWISAHWSKLFNMGVNYQHSALLPSASAPKTPLKTAKLG